jgi:capsid protein
MAVAAAVEVPYEILTGDLSRVNDRTVRMILNEFRRRVQQWQHQVVVYQLCRPVYEAWWDRAILAGALSVSAAAFDADPAAYLGVKWIPQGWPYLYPLQDVQAQREAIRAGLKSRAEAVSEQGDDVETVDAEIAADQERADRLKLLLDVDGRISQLNGAFRAEPKDAAVQEQADQTQALALEAVKLAAERPPVVIAEGAIQVTLPAPPPTRTVVKKQVQYNEKGRIVGVQEVHSE